MVRYFYRRNKNSNPKIKKNLKVPGNVGIVNFSLKYLPLLHEDLAFDYNECLKTQTHA